MNERVGRTRARCQTTPNHTRCTGKGACAPVFVSRRGFAPRLLRVRGSFQAAGGWLGVAMVNSSRRPSASPTSCPRRPSSIAMCLAIFALPALIVDGETTLTRVGRKGRQVEFPEVDLSPDNRGCGKHHIQNCSGEHERRDCAKKSKVMRKRSRAWVQ